MQDFGKLPNIGIQPEGPMEPTEDELEQLKAALIDQARARPPQLQQEEVPVEDTALAASIDDRFAEPPPVVGQPPMEGGNLQDQLKSYLQSRLMADPSQDIQKARTDAKMEEINNQLKAAGMNYLRSVRGGEANVPKSGQAAARLAELLKAEQDRTGTLDRLAMSGLQKEETSGDGYTRPTTRVIGGDTKYAGLPVEYEDRKGYFIRSGGTKIYQGSSDDPELEQAFKDAYNPGRSMTPERLTLAESKQAGDILKAQSPSEKSIQSFADLKEAKNDMDEIEMMMDKYGDKLPTGKWKELWEDNKDWVPFFRPKADEEHELIKNIVGKNLVKFVKDTSGLAVTNEERRALTKLLPNAGLPPDKFRIAYNEWKRKLIETVANNLEANAELGKDVTRTAESFQRLGLFTPSERFIELQSKLIPREELKDKQRKALGLPKGEAKPKVTKVPAKEKTEAKTVMVGGKPKTKAEIEAGMAKAQAKGNDVLVRSLQKILDDNFKD